MPIRPCERCRKRSGSRKKSGKNPASVNGAKETELERQDGMWEGKSRPTDSAVEEPMTTVRIPESTWHLFHAVMEQPVTQASERYLHQIETSMACNNELYPLPVECTDQGISRGRLTDGEINDSVFYPGASRKYWVYEPAGTETVFEPRSLILVLDANFFMLDPKTGLLLEDPPILRLFDNLTAEKRIPPSVILLACYGEPGPGQPVNGFSEGEVNRSVEYDTTSDWHARFLTEEFMPVALRGFNVSDRAEDHVICGFSSSGIAAFSAAWFRTDVFGKLYIGSPSFVNIRNGIVWPSAIRIHDKKEIKVFQTAGKHDLDNIFGSWLYANYDVACALEYAGYEHLFYVSEAGHSLAVYFYTMPQGLAWLFGGEKPVFQRMEQVTFSEMIR